MLRHRQVSMKKKWAPTFAGAPKAISQFELERVAKRELHFTRRASRSSNGSEGSSRDANSRQAKAVMVEGIVGLPTNLD